MFNKIWDVGWTVGRAASVSRSSNKRAGVLSARRRPATTKTNRRQRTVTALFHYRVKWSARRSAAAAAGQPRVKRRHDCCCCNGPGMLRVLITQVQDKYQVLRLCNGPGSITSQRRASERALTSVVAPDLQPFCISAQRRPPNETRRPRLTC